jgi:glycosyltransferase involved in cell wall biosynthesis
MARNGSSNCQTPQGKSIGTRNRGEAAVWGRSLNRNHALNLNPGKTAVKIKTHPVPTAAERGSHSLPIKSPNRIARHPLPIHKQRTKHPVKVSVATVTYNHEPFLEQAVESGLAQRTNFPFEIVIGEDCSTDGTRAVARRLAAKHPDRVRLLLRESNLGLTRNTAATLSDCRGEYIAILEGDDFWIDPNKLQRQADYLDANPDCAWCFTRAKVVDENGAVLDVPPVVWNVQEKYSLADYLDRKFQPRFCTVMFRRGLFTKYPDWFFRMGTADFPIHVFNTYPDGKIGFIDAEMSAYRVHAGGVWSQGMNPGAPEGQTPEARRRLAKRFAESVALYSAVDRHLGGPYRDILRRQIANHAEQWTQLNLSVDDLPLARRSSATALWARLMSRQIPSRKLVAAFLKSWIG